MVSTETTPWDLKLDAGYHFPPGCDICFWRKVISIRHLNICSVHVLTSKIATCPASTSTFAFSCSFSAVSWLWEAMMALATPVSFIQLARKPN